jgi:hypothetical protein
VFLHGGTVISCKSCKHTLIGTSTNHYEIIALYEATHECARLHRVINHIQVSCGIEPIRSPTIIYEDNATCITRMQSGYVKNNVTKRITPKLFYPHELQVNGEISILQIKLCDNLVDLFTKSLPYLKMAMDIRYLRTHEYPTRWVWIWIPVFTRGCGYGFDFISTDKLRMGMKESCPYLLPQT